MYMGLQVCRGIAALAVLLHHTSLGSEVFYGGKAFSGFWEFGAIGVDFFFVLSGFIIYWVHSDDQQSLKYLMMYWKKRIIRIYPPFILISIILLIAYSTYPSLSAGGRSIGIVTSIFLVPTPPLEPALSVSWTLMHEMLFYTTFILLFINKRMFHTFLVAWGLSILLVNFMPIDGIIKTFFLSPYNIEFLLGVVSAVIIKSNKGNIFQLLTGLFMLLFYIAYLNDQTDNYIILNNILVRLYLGFTFMFIVTGLCSIDNKIKYPNFLIFIGASSYSIYLIHNPAISILNRVAQKITSNGSWGSPEIIFLFVAISSLIIGLAYYLIWEKPILKIMKGQLIKKL